MHAVVTRVSIKGDVAEAQQHVHNNVVPRVKEAPGVIAGYWVELPGGKGAAITLFETEDAARAAAEMAQNAPRPEAVTFDSLEVGEVFAQV